MFDRVAHEEAKIKANGISEMLEYAFVFFCSASDHKRLPVYCLANRIRQAYIDLAAFAGS